MTIYTNIAITNELQAVLDRFWDEWHKGADKANDPATCAGMLDLVDSAKEAFAKAPRRGSVDEASASLTGWLRKWGMPSVADHAASALKPLLADTAVGPTLA